MLDEQQPTKCDITNCEMEITHRFRHNGKTIWLCQDHAQEFVHQLTDDAVLSWLEKHLAN